jgi:hypothetical protein
MDRSEQKSASTAAQNNVETLLHALHAESAHSDITQDTEKLQDEIIDVEITFPNKEISWKVLTSIQKYHKMKDLLDRILNDSCNEGTPEFERRYAFLERAYHRWVDLNDEKCIDVNDLTGATDEQAAPLPSSSTVEVLQVNKHSQEKLSVSVNNDLFSKVKMKDSKMRGRSKTPQKQVRAAKKLAIQKCKDDNAGATPVVTEPLLWNSLDLLRSLRRMPLSSFIKSFPIPLKKSRFIISVVKQRKNINILKTVSFQLPKDTLNAVSEEIIAKHQLRVHASEDELLEYVTMYDDEASKASKSEKRFVRYAVKLFYENNEYYFDSDVISQLMSLHTFKGFIKTKNEAEAWVARELGSVVVPELLAHENSSSLDVLSSSAVNFLQSFCPEKKVFLGNCSWILDDGVWEEVNVYLRERDLLDLLGPEWLGDNVIEALMMRACSFNKKLYYLNSLALDSLPQRSGFKDDESFLEAYNLKAIALANSFAKKLHLSRKKGVDPAFILHPLNLGRQHWALTIISLKDHSIIKYEPLASFNAYHKEAKLTLQSVLRYLDDGDEREWTFKKNGPDIVEPKQLDGSGCGIFVAMFAEVFAKLETLDQTNVWNQHHISFLRLRALRSITNLACKFKVQKSLQ